MPGIFKSIKNFLTGTPGKVRQISTLRPDQEILSQQLVNAGTGPGAGGAFGTSADYYRNLLSDNPADLAAFTAPALRQYNQDIVPGISEQFAGMGSGGLSSSGFRNAQVQGATDLAERLAAMRSSLRQAGAAGLSNIGQLGLQGFQQNYEQPGTPGLLPSAAQGFGNAVTQGFGNLASSWFGGGGNRVGANTSPYGAGIPKASPTSYR